MDQMVNGLRKIAGASIFQLKQQHIYTCVYEYIYMQNRTEGKTAVSICLLQTEKGKSKLPFVCCKQKQKFIFPCRQMINDNQQLLLQPRCPFMLAKII
jgi:hypothetical protein